MWGDTHISACDMASLYFIIFSLSLPHTSTNMHIYICCSFAVLQNSFIEIPCLPLYALQSISHSTIVLFPDVNKKKFTHEKVKFNFCVTFCCNIFLALVKCYWVSRLFCKQSKWQCWAWMLHSCGRTGRKWGEISFAFNLPFILSRSHRSVFQLRKVYQRV